MTTPAAPEQLFIERWAASGAAERANYQLFLSELCALLGVPAPEPSRADDAENAYVFEKNVHFQEFDGTTSIGRIDLYKRGAFVLEAKQGSDAQSADDEAAARLLPASAKKSKRRGTAVRGTQAWDDAMVRARGQAERYARALPVAEGWPPFLIVVDVGHSIELYSDFSRSGKTYVPFPDPQAFRIGLADLGSEDMRARLRQVWLDPLALDPSRRTAKVTRELAQRLAELAKLLEKAGHPAEDVAGFLMRSLFTMFAEDVELIPTGSFKKLLAELRDEPQHFQPAAEDLWRTMNTGGFSGVLRKQLRRFNGGLFADCEALPLTRPMLELLHEAAGADWADVEPAIFGTLLERALDPVERHKLGAHYTPRAYVERLVLPTVIEPLREDWQAAYAAAVSAAKQGDLSKAQQTVRDFHEQLCKTRVLDPACGSGNFLYVTLEQMKRLEGEVLNALREFGDRQQVLFEVAPHQFLGLEVNPRAAAIADLVLWIGYLQWHFRTRGHTAPAEPIIKNYHNIECRDAVLAWDRKEPVLDERGKPVTRWDGRTMKRHPVTGEKVPDDSARVSVERYINPRKAEWPAAEYVVGNPPFIGNKRMRDALGDGYVDALRQSYPDLPDSCDYVMVWWAKAAARVASRDSRRLGLITTNSITQHYSRKVVDSFLDAALPISLVFTAPDHPWVDSELGANVRIAMSVAKAGYRECGKSLILVSESSASDGTVQIIFDQKLGEIDSSLRVNKGIGKVVALQANKNLCWQGCKLVGEHFQVPPSKALEWIKAEPTMSQYLRQYWSGNDVTKLRDARFVIDFFGTNDLDGAKRAAPALFQHLADYVYPERASNRDKTFREKWWLFGRPRPELRESLKGIRRYIATSEVSKHRIFRWLEWPLDLIDGGVIGIAVSDSDALGILSSRVHVVWALASGGRLEDRPRYQNFACFDPFPFPVCTDAQKARIGELGEQLDAHRKRQQALHPKLTLTNLYNVLEKLRAGEELTAKERETHEEGLVSVLKQIHDDLDAAVFEAYGWPTSLSDEEILQRLVDLNAERAAEEAQGLIRWLRPDFQNPLGTGETQRPLTLSDDDESDEAPAAKPSRRRGKKSAEASELTKEPGGKRPRSAKLPWPKGREAQAKGVLAALREAEGSVTPDEIAQRFARAPRETVAELLEALATLGQARRLRGGKYSS